MAKKTARTSQEKDNSSGTDAHMGLVTSWTSVPQDEIFMKRISELESRIEHLEYLLMLTECERDRYKRKACA